MHSLSGVVLCIVALWSYDRVDALFPKDQSIDLVFPPKSRRSATGIPDGWQRIPQGKVTETANTTDPAEFWETHVKTKKPLVLREGYNQSSEIFTTWDDNYLKSEYGDIMVDVTTKHPGSIIEPQVMKLKKFLKRYNLEDWYLVSPVPNEMLHAIPMVPSLLCGSFKNFLQEVEIWMSSGGTSTKLHYDPDHNMHCLVSGRKDFILYDREHADIFDFEHDETEGRGESKIDPEMVNMFEHPKIARTPWIWTTLKPGDCIFIPSVVAAAKSRVQTQVIYNLKDRGKQGLAAGQRVVNRENFTTDPDMFRHHLYSLLRDDDKLQRERFFTYYEKIRDEESKERKLTPHAAFRQLDLQKKNYVTAEQIAKLSPKLIERIVKKFIRPGYANEQQQVRDEL